MTDMKPAESSIGTCGYELHRLYGATIDHIEFVGGEKYGNKLKIFFTDGKLLHVDAELDTSKLAIKPQIKYSVGGWGTVQTLQGAAVEGEKG